MDDWRAFRRAGEAGRLRVRLMSYMNAPEAAEANPRRRHGCTATACAWSGSSCSPTARSARAARGSSSPMPTSPTPAGCRAIRTPNIWRWPMPARRAASRSRPTRSAMPPMRRSFPAYEQLHAEIRRDRRWRIEHFQIADPADIPRLAPAGIIASMQPTHQTSDRLMAEKRLGPNRLAGAYAWQIGAQIRRETGFRNRLPGRIAQPLPRPRRRDQPAGHAGPAAGRLDSERAADVRAGAGGVHARRGLCRLRRGPDRRASNRANGPISSSSTATRPKSMRRPRADAGAGNLGRGKEGVGESA